MSSTNIGNPYMTNSSLLNPTFNSGNTTGYYPAMPYPNNIPSMDTSNTTSINSSNENALNNEFPSEPSSNDLFSYNTTDFRNISYYLYKMHFEKLNPIIRALQNEVFLIILLHTQHYIL